MSQEFNYNQNTYNDNKGRTLAVISVILGGLSILSLMMIVPSIPLAGLGIIFALLSRGDDKGLGRGPSRLGLLLSTAGLTAGIVAIASAAIFMLQNTQVTQMYQQMYDDMYDYYYNGGEYPDIDNYLSPENI